MYPNASVPARYRGSHHKVGGLLKAVSFFSRLGKVGLLKILHQSDYRRWRNPENLELWWIERTEMIARLIPKNSRVIEFGAGLRQLEKFLDSSCSYIPSDLTDRGPGTIICDLNRRPLPDLRGARLPAAVGDHRHDLSRPADRRDP